MKQQQPLLSVNDLEMTMGSKLLFEGLSFGIFEGEKIGLIGPNGSGKSTLLKLLAGRESPDGGEVHKRKNLNLAYVAQEALYEDQSTVHSIVKSHLMSFGADELESDVQASVYLSIVGFEDLDAVASALSGGWKKRLSIAAALAQEPDLLILDEPTNHMDWDGILWLEGWLKSYKKSILLVSHDRVFLDRLANRTIEINKLYRDGFLSFNCGYQQFLEKKEDYVEAQMNLQETLSNKARREVEWLRAGVKARTTKSQSRIKEAHQLIDQLQNVKNRNRSGRAASRVEIDSTERKSKKLIELKKVSVAFGDHQLVNDLDLLMGPKNCLGFLGANGSGKTSVLKVITGSADNYTGDIYRADDLKIVYFDQNREDLPRDNTLVEYLGDGSDYTVFKGDSIHVASYASRFLFTSDQMQMKISHLSGGEQARLLIAKLLLQPADVLILDEPTNDLDIETIEILEESLSAFEGLVILVSHDRYFLGRLCQRLLALNGDGTWAVYSEAEQWLRERLSESSGEVAPAVAEEAKKSPKKVRLSYKEKHQLETMESDIQRAEKELQEAQAALEDPENLADHKKITELAEEAAQKQKVVDDLYALWSELEQKS